MARARRWVGAVLVGVLVVAAAPGTARAETAGTILFSRWGADPIEKLYTVPAAGGAGTLLLDSPGVSNVQATYSPDGKRVALLRGDSTGAINGIWVMHRDGSGLAAVPGTWGGWAPAWSPDGRWLAYANNVTGTNQIYVVHPDGTGLTRVTVDGLDDTHPTWSPDGRSIAFAQGSTCCDGGAITVLDLGTGVERRLTSGTDLDSWPAWSAANWIAFSRYGTGPVCHLFVVRPDGTGLAQITSGATQDKEPAWSPDGYTVVFSRVMTPATTPLPSYLFAVKYTGYGLRQITSDPSDVDEVPTWGP